MELLGFDMNALPFGFAHRLMRPVGVRLCNVLEPDNDGDPVFVDGDEAICIEGFTLEDVKPAETGGVLWDLVALSDGRIDVLDLVRRWGLVWDDADEDGWAYWGLGLFYDEANLIKAFLETLAETDKEQLVDAEVLEVLKGGWSHFLTSYFLGDFATVRRLAKVLVPGLAEPRLHESGYGWAEEVWDALRNEAFNETRRNGRGLELQRELITEVLRKELWRQPIYPTWDENGRQAQREATGIRQIAWSHIFALFAAETLDVYRCSVCGKPYPFNDHASARRPMRGKGSYCSDDCRREAKKASNRRSWQRHGKDWRPRKQGTG